VSPRGYSCKPPRPPLSRLGTINVDDHRTTPSKEQYYLLSLGLRRIDVAVHRTGRDVEEISRLDGGGIPSAGAVLEAGRSRDDVAVDVVVAVVMPAGDHARIDARANHHESFPRNARCLLMPGLGGACESASLCSALILAMSVFHPWFLYRSARVYCNEGVKEAATSENSVMTKFGEFTFPEGG
jgi:hypothetical protein